MFRGFLGGSMVKNLPANTGDVGSIPGSEDPLEKEMTTHSNIPGLGIPWTEEPGGLQSIGLQIGHDFATEHQTTKHRVGHSFRKKCLGLALWKLALLILSINTELK